MLFLSAQDILVWARMGVCWHVCNMCEGIWVCIGMHGRMWACWDIRGYMWGCVWAFVVAMECWDTRGYVWGHVCECAWTHVVLGCSWVCVDARGY